MRHFESFLNIVIKEEVVFVVLATTTWIFGTSFVLGTQQRFRNEQENLLSQFTNYEIEMPEF